MAETRQNADGSLGIYSENPIAELFRVGGPKAAGGSPATPNFRPGSSMQIPMTATTATTGGAIGAWTNNLGYDIIVTSAYLDVQTQSTGAASVNVGQTPTSLVTSSSNLIAAVAVGAAGIKPSALAAKVKQGEFITITGSADTTGLVGNLIADFVPA